MEEYSVIKSTAQAIALVDIPRRQYLRLVEQLPQSAATRKCSKHACNHR